MDRPEQTWTQSGGVSGTLHRRLDAASLAHDPGNDPVAHAAEDLVKRTYITLGFTAWLMLLPLAVTSTTAWQRRLKRRWITLHQLIYPAAIMGSIHYLWLVKADTREPLVYLAILLGLL